MASTPFATIDLTSRAFDTSSKLPSTLLNAFGQMMHPQPILQKEEIRDQCQRPSPIYNSNYNPNRPPPDNLPGGYSPYVFGEPLYDNREAIVSRLPH